ncbi:hypothetical protein DPMN_108470 [Dreissena polymorpha]|uniref:Uncharacterized protein n=1 Tax=Dreissena polymorpha TaxID=45954 RepID=A0A9D4QM24_DREPO|nr:hypothetical protein DPMN_108470 [Dreissena polymorpha]
MPDYLTEYKKRLCTVGFERPAAKGGCATPVIITCYSVIFIFCELECGMTEVFGFRLNKGGNPIRACKRAERSY